MAAIIWAAFSGGWRCRGGDAPVVRYLRASRNNPKVSLPGWPPGNRGRDLPGSPAVTRLGFKPIDLRHVGPRPKSQRSLSA
jgi:hypothetical protein